MQFVLPMPADVVEFHNEPGFGRGLACRIGRGTGIASGAGRAVGQRARFVRLETYANALLADGGGLVPGLESSDVNGVAVRTHGESTRRVGEEAEDRQRRAAHSGTEARWIEDPDIGARNSRRGGLRIARARHVRDRRIGTLLATMRSGDKRVLRTAREDDIARLIADQ